MGMSFFKTPNGMQAPQNSQQSVLAQFSEFASNFQKNFNCTPQQKVQELLNSGQMTRQEFEQYSQIANRLTGRK